MGMKRFFGAVVMFQLASLLAMAATEQPWEVKNCRGDSVLPNLFYAENSQNEQVMPLTMKNGRLQIDRMVYPTIGNPALFTRDLQGDCVMFVLRLEPDALAHLNPTISETVMKNGTALQTLKLDEKLGDALSFYLISRVGRRVGATESASPISAGSGIFQVRPSQILLRPLDATAPKDFQGRQTLQVYFDASALAKVEAGLYDIRFEVTQGKTIPGKKYYEFQYNAVRIFDKYQPGYYVLNVTDTQASISESLVDGFKKKTMDKLGEFVQYVNKAKDDTIRNAAFITFNGDLHNGGSPATLLAREVAETYNLEAISIVEKLKELNYPIFLVIGNHDGYVSTGHVPQIGKKKAGDKQPENDSGGLAGWFASKVEAARTTLNKYDSFGMFDGLDHLIDVIKQKNPQVLSKFEAYLTATRNQPGGKHVDIFSGKFVRKDSNEWEKGWIELSEEDRNMVLYDGFYQWQKTYGPTYSSFSFGKNVYFNLNSYELRQHRRTGWGMYTMNYGGGMSRVQMKWLSGQLKEKGTTNDIILLAHHDPRGGHNGEDYPYYFKQVDYVGMDQSASNYVWAEVINPKRCTMNIPGVEKSAELQSSCFHDGLQEWMRPDPEFDCHEEDRKGPKGIGKCKDNVTEKLSKPLWYSGYALVHWITTTENLRTLLLGHTHWNSYEMLQSGDELVPKIVSLDYATQQKLAGLDRKGNPLRNQTQVSNGRGLKPQTIEDNSSADTEGQQALFSENKQMFLNLSVAGHNFQNDLRGKELAILRLTSASDLTSQTLKNNKNQRSFGFSTFAVGKRSDYQSPSYTLPQIFFTRYFLNTENGNFQHVGDVFVNRKKKVNRTDADNPVNSPTGLFIKD